MSIVSKNLTNIILPHLRQFLMTIFIMQLSTFVFAQTSTLMGKVTSENDVALSGVTISLIGTDNSVITDKKGEFKINASKNAILRLSLKGFKTLDIYVGDKESINVIMQSDELAESSLPIGFGNQHRNDITGVVTQMSKKGFNKDIMTAPQDMLVGKIAGVQITSNDGSPGSSSIINIRGINSFYDISRPLIVIDGVPMDNSEYAGILGMQNPLTLINPKDIESMTILKDASTASIYGMRASNGVILITTKKATEDRLQIVLNSSVAVSTLPKSFAMLSGEQLKTLADAELASGLPGLNSDALTRLGSANTNWQKEITQNTISTNQHISVSGMYKKIPIRASYGYTNQDGVIKTTNMNRNSISLSIVPTFFNGNLQIESNLKAVSQTQNFGNSSAYKSALEYDPTQVVYSGVRKWGGYKTWTQDSAGVLNNPLANPITIAPANPVALLNQTQNIATVLRSLGNLKFDYRWHSFPSLRLILNTGFDFAKSNANNNSPTNSAFTYSAGGGYLNNSTGNNSSSLLEAYTEYAAKNGPNKIVATFGYSHQNFDDRSTSFIRNGQNPPIYFLSQLTMGPNGNPQMVPYQNPPAQNRLRSFFGRINYSFNDKYLLSISIRNDASSRFTQNHGQFFPAIAMGWRIHKESFMRDTESVSEFKIRGSYGITGNQAGNKTMTESTTHLDIGLDFGFFNNRISGSFDWYQKNAANLTNIVPAPSGNNYSNYIITNEGAMSNRGIELAIEALLIKSKDLQWHIGINIAHNENKITKLFTNLSTGLTWLSKGPLITGGIGRYVESFEIGQPIYSFRVLQQIYSKQGTPLEGEYVDQSHQGGNVATNPLNLTHYHSPNPSIIAGINTCFNIRRFDFNFSGHGSFGNWVYSNNESSTAFFSNLYNPAGFFNNLPVSVFNSSFVQAQYQSSYYVRNASFFRMDNINLSYSLNGFKKQKVRISLSVQNAFVITKYNGVDPEVNSGVDYAQYPRPRIYLLGLTFQ